MWLGIANIAIYLRIENPYNYTDIINDINGSGERIRTSDLRVMRPQVFVTLQLSIFLQKYIYPLL